MNYLTSLLFGAALGAIVACLLPLPEPPQVFDFNRPWIVIESGTTKFYQYNVRVRDNGDGSREICQDVKAEQP